MTRLTIAAVLLGTILLLGSCNEIKLKGRQVTFRASTGEVGTKTAYGDDYDDSGTTWQFIDWVDGDLLRIVSNKAPGPSGENYADYVVTSHSTGSGHQCNAEIAPTPNGLTWDGTGQYDFYAVYPSPELSKNNGSGAVTSIAHNVNNDDDTDYGHVIATLPNTLTLPSEFANKYLNADGTAVEEGSSDIAYTYKVFAPDMAKAVMTAAATGISEDSEVSLVFKPAFTAFEFNMTSADENFTVTKVELLSIKQVNGKWVEDDNSETSDKLAGKFRMKKAVTFEPQSPVYNKVTVTMNQALTTASGVTFTIFTLPVANSKMLGLRVTTTSGVATLPLTKSQSTEAYVFAPGKKYRINMLKLGGTWKYKIALTPKELPWDLVEETTTFSQNIQASPFNIEHATETDNNYYPEGTKVYQTRTLNMDYDHFLVTFKPMAPMGGYWQLIPENVPDSPEGDLGTQAFKVEVWDTDADEGSPDLKGQIMNQTVTLHITRNVTDEQRTVPHSIIIKSYFSTSVSFDENSTYSADSEIQDAHKDGSFSYWRFVIPAKTN